MQTLESVNARPNLFPSTLQLAAAERAWLPRAFVQSTMKSWMARASQSSPFSSFNSDGRYERAKAAA